MLQNILTSTEYWISVRNIFIAGACVLSSRWAFRYFGMSCFEQITYHIKVSLRGVNLAFMRDWFRMCGLPSLLVALVLSAIGTAIFEQPEAISFALVVASIIYALFHIGFIRYCWDRAHWSTLYEDEYVDAAEAVIHAPEHKKNLIHIILESMETTYLAKADGGNSDEDLLPFLTQLAKENLSFSHTDKLGGAAIPYGLGWTTGGVVGSESGVALTFPFTSKRIFRHTQFLPGMTNLGDILREDGYRQVYLIGSDAEFGGRGPYYRTHGDYEILDQIRVKEKGWLPKDYHVFWGYEDAKLFDFAKRELTELAAGDEPFNLTMLTVDTHHPYGYQDETMRKVSPYPLSNTIRHTDELLEDFFEWLQEQPFYEDTVIIVHGDHISMAAEYIHQVYDKDFDRRAYNAWVHADGVGGFVNSKKRRFSNLDFFPTMLHALGYRIEGDRLGLGTDLFSGRKTLLERMSIRKLNHQLCARSRYYHNRIMRKRK